MATRKYGEFGFWPSKASRWKVKCTKARLEHPDPAIAAAWGEIDKARREIRRYEKPFKEWAAGVYADLLRAERLAEFNGRYNPEANESVMRARTEFATALGLEPNASREEILEACRTATSRFTVHGEIIRLHTIIDTIYKTLDEACADLPVVGTVREQQEEGMRDAVCGSAPSGPSPFL